VDESSTASDDEHIGEVLRLVVVVAASIPPVQGQALVARRVAERLATAGHEVHFVSRNPRHLRRGTGYCFALVGGLVRAFWRSIALRGHTPKSVYVTSSGGLGILAEGVCTALLVRRADTLVVHHHSFAYLNEPSIAFRVVARSAYRRAHHVVLCEHMALLLARAGVDRSLISIVSNAAFIDAPDGVPESVRSSQLRLGHLSNLSIEKGLDLVLEVLESTPPDVCLTVFGAPTDTRSRDLLSGAKMRFPDRLRHVDATDRTAVWDFYGSIDLFLFPSRYRNEAAPLVVLEALAAGVPVVASDLGCIPSQLSPELAGLVTSPDRFGSLVSEVVTSMLQDRDYPREMAQRARRQWKILRGTSELDSAELLSLIVSGIH
jgi:glycosyltransferase involved in cell wall biosynthesis